MGVWVQTPAAKPQGELERNMAGQYVCMALAALLLLGVAAVSTSKGLKGKERQRASRIPSQFSQEERVTMKETLKGELGSPSPTFAQIYEPLSPPASAVLPSPLAERPLL